VRSRLAHFSPDPKLDGLLDRIIEDQSKLGRA
jgi:hypothetical protein